MRTELFLADANPVSRAFISSKVIQSGIPCQINVVEQAEVLKQQWNNNPTGIFLIDIGFPGFCELLMHPRFFPLAFRQQIHVLVNEKPEGVIALTLHEYNVSLMLKTQTDEEWGVSIEKMATTTQWIHACKY